MFSFLKIMRPVNHVQPSMAPNSRLPDNTPQNNTVRRELIRVVLKDTLRLQGIPFGWLACEVIVIARAPGEEDLHIQLGVMKWSEQLMRFAAALQQQLLLDLDRFEPAVDHSKYIVSWRFSPECGCPFTNMPDPKTWIKNSPKVKPDEEPVSVLDRRQTKRLPNPSQLSPSLSEPYDRSTDFSPTQITPLQ